MASKKLEDFNAWLGNLNLQSNQMSPEAILQMSRSAAPQEGVGAMSMPPQAPQEELGGMSMPPEEPQKPQLNPAQQAPVRPTVQPTMPKAGDLPQEIVPEQISLMESRQTSTYGKSPLLQQLALGEKSFADKTDLQQIEIDKLKSGLSRYQKQSRDFDFRPMAAFVDSTFGGGGNYGKAAEGMAPESSAQKEARIAEMQQRIAGAQGEMTKSELEALRNRLQQIGYEEQRKTALDVAKISAAGGRSSELEQREAARLDRETQALEKRIGDAAPGMAAKFENMNALIPGGIDGDESVDVPGVGPGMFMVPDFMMGDQASKIQQNARGLMADYLKLRSGTAASDKEVLRIMSEFGMAPGAKSSSFRAGLKRLRTQTSLELRNKQAGFRPEVVKLYKDRGGLTDKDINNIGKGGSIQQDMSSPGGMTPELMEELKALEAEGF